MSSKLEAPNSLDLWLSSAGAPLLIIKPADDAGAVQTLNTSGQPLEMSIRVMRDFGYQLYSRPAVAARIPSLFTYRSDLSARARTVLLEVAVGVADICPQGMEPPEADTIARITSISLGQLLPTLGSLVRKGLVAPWPALGRTAVSPHQTRYTRYVPTIAGILALGKNAPTREAVLAARRSANPMLADAGAAEATLPGPRRQPSKRHTLDSEDYAA